jgi:hypothetical protein
MTVPPNRPPEWGSGIPGIPSIWDTGTATRTSPQTPWVPPRRNRPAGRHWRPRWLAVAVGLTALLGVVGGSLAGGEQSTVVVGPEQFDVPFEEFAPPPPGPGGPDPFAPDMSATGLVATRADGGGEPFGLPLGSTVLVRDDLADSLLEVRPLSVTREQGLVLLDVELHAPAGTSFSVVPALLLRLPDGREVQHGELHGDSPGQGYVPVLGPGQTWRATLGFRADAAGAVLVLVRDDGSTLAGWRITDA